MSLVWADDHVPMAAEYREFAEISGIGPRSAAGAARGLTSGLFGVTVRDDGRLVGMGRLVGDGGTVVHVVDVAVHPDYRRRGIGRQVMTRLLDWARDELPTGCRVSLIADPGSFALCRALGFEIRTGMQLHLP